MFVAAGATRPPKQPSPRPAPVSRRRRPSDPAWEKTKPPVTTTDEALAYRDRLLSSLPADDVAVAAADDDDGGGGRRRRSLEPLMTLYLTNRTTPDEIRRAHATGLVLACKYYPAGATTNSDAGVTDVRNVYPALRAMADVGMLLLIHSEVSTPCVDVFDRESVFIDTIIKPLVRDMPPDLRIVLEHISTKDAVEYVTGIAQDNVRATITPHHLLYNRNDMLAGGGIRPHLYCLPILKREGDRHALLGAIASGSSRFFAGTDSAPHDVGSKESSCGCAGIYTAHAALELYAEAFECAGALDKLEGFLCHHGADFYGLPRNDGGGGKGGGGVILEKWNWTVPGSYKFGNGVVRPLRAGETVAWSIVDGP